MFKLQFLMTLMHIFIVIRNIRYLIGEKYMKLGIYLRPAFQQKSIIIVF